MWGIINPPVLQCASQILSLLIYITILLSYMLSFNLTLKLYNFPKVVPVYAGFLRQVAGYFNHLLTFACMLIVHEIMHSRDAQCNTGE